MPALREPSPTHSTGRALDVLLSGVPEVAFGLAQKETDNEEVKEVRRVHGESCDTAGKTRRMA